MANAESLQRALQHDEFIPTGGISPQNLSDYLKFPKVIACGGTWMVKTELIAEKKFDRITNLCREAVQLASRI